MPFFTRRQVYDSGRVRKARAAEPTTAPLPTTNAERERYVAQTFEDAVKATLATPHLQFKHLVRLLEDPRFGPIEVIDKFPWDVFERTFREAETALIDQLIDGANQEVFETFLNFSARDPEVLIWGATHAAEMVTHISEEQRRLLRNHVMNAHLSGIPPIQLAREIRGVIGLTPRWQQAVVRYHRGLLAKGTNEAFAAKQTAKYHARLRTARAKMIARTEVMRAENEGKVLGWERAIANGLLTPNGKMQWHTAITNVCPVCLPMDGQTADLGSTFRVADPSGKSWDVRTPPSHPHCRCTLTYLPPSVEEMTGGMSLDDLIAEISPTPYTPDDPAEDESAWDTTNLTLAPAPTPDPPRVPNPPTFTRRAEAQKWAETHLPLTSHTEETYRRDPLSGRLTFLPGTPGLLPRFFDFEDLALPVVQDMIEAAVDFANTFPDAWGTLTRYGTLQAIYRDRRDLPDSVGGGVYAQSTSLDPSLNHRTVGLNKAWFTSTATYDATYAQDVATNFHPPTAASATRTVLDHEFGHILLYHIATIHGQDALSGPGGLLTYLEAHTGQPPSFWALASPTCTSYITNHLSRYATESWHEFVAEAWAEYLHAPNPRPIARAVGQWVHAHTP